MTWFKSICIVILASATSLAPASLYAHDDDDDDDDRKRSRQYKKKIGREVDYSLYCRCPSPASTAVEPGPTMPAPVRKPAARSPESFPKETPTERASARERQVELLEKELVEEHALLSKAATAQAHEDVELHRKNVAAIRRELGNLYR